jgi:sugar/nucleoside kinase (ribokinase family)
MLFDPADFPWKFDVPPVVVIGSVYHEFNSDRIFRFIRKKASFIAFDPQGCFRSLTSQGQITFQKLSNPEILRNIDCLKISEIEAKNIGGEDNPLQVITQILKTSVKIVLLTRGSKGALLGIRSLDTGDIIVYSIPAYTTEKIIDETGAGDVFLYAFVVHYETHHDALDAVAFATSVSSVLIEKKGVEGNFKKEKILTRQEYVRKRIKPL